MTLQSHARLLHLLHARNRNQHNRAVWYRSFGVLRREVRRLCEELGISVLDLNGGADTGGGAHASAKQARTTKKVGERGWVDSAEKERLRTKTTETKVLRRCEYWRDKGLVERWYLSFTHLITSTQFAPLGLTLLAILARLCSITGCTAAFQRLASEAEAQQVLRLGKKLQEDEPESEPGSKAVEGAADVQDDDTMDIGVVVARNDEDDTSMAVYEADATPYHPDEDGELARPQAFIDRSSDDFYFSDEDEQDTDVMQRVSDTTDE